MQQRQAAARRHAAPGRGLPARVARLCARSGDPLDLLEEVAAAVRPEIPYAVAGWLLVDPDTLLVTGVYSEGITREQNLAVVRLELTTDDVTKFWELAATGVDAASLWTATGGDLSRSARWAGVYGPAGLGDELRTVFRSGGSTWGHGCLTRAADDPPFAPAEVALVARLCPHIGHGLRTRLLLARDPRPGPDRSAPAVLVLADDGSVVSATPQVEEWLGPLDGETLGTTIVLHEVAHQARALVAGGTGPPALARTRSVSGRWLLARATVLDDARVAVVLEPADGGQLAPVLLRLHGLTEREREVTGLLLTGMPSAAIAARLWITAETLHSHVKSVYAKLGVRSRPELAALAAPEPDVRTAAPR